MLQLVLLSYFILFCFSYQVFLISTHEVYCFSLIFLPTSGRELGREWLCGTELLTGIKSQTYYLCGNNNLYIQLNGTAPLRKTVQFTPFPELY